VPVNTVPPIGFLNLDQVVEIVESKSGWVRVKNPLGWMETSWLKLPDNDNGGNPAPVPAEYAVCRANALNVRSGPGTSHPVVGYIQMGQRVKVLDRQNNWALLESPSGWSQGTYLTPA
jgi:N-acetylmuramoyl-L-alanine amidase